SVGIPEVDVSASAARARVALYWPRHDLDTTTTQVLHRFFDWPRPDEAQIAVSRFHRLLGVQPSESRPVHIELPVAEAIVAEPGVPLVDLCAKHLAIEGIRAFPIGHCNHAMVNGDRWRHVAH